MLFVLKRVYNRRIMLTICTRHLKVRHTTPSQNTLQLLSQLPNTIITTFTSNLRPFRSTQLSPPSQNRSINNRPSTRCLYTNRSRTIWQTMRLSVQTAVRCQRGEELVCYGEETSVCCLG